MTGEKDCSFVPKSKNGERIPLGQLGIIKNRIDDKDPANHSSDKDAEP